MDSFQVYSYGTALWLSLQSIPLLLAPSLIITLLEPNVRDATDLETYFARAAALAQLSLALLTLLQSDLFTVQTPTAANDTTDADKPHATPTLVLTALYHVAAFIHAYTKYTAVGQTALLLGSIGSGVLAATGGFVLMFGDERARGSRWPFESTEQRTRRKEKKRARRKDL